MGEIDKITDTLREIIRPIVIDLRGVQSIKNNLKNAQLEDTQ
ncbi:hypothetical protein AABB28_04495 [Yoonia algicola]|uniref:Uncharacterized protein n=1 Tax=Yoonia algicola TaxID=3137368 RepID=A0AAN0M9F4_9RHOB